MHFCTLAMPPTSIVSRIPVSRQWSKPFAHGKFVLALGSRRDVAGRVFGHTQIVEDQSDISVELAHFFGEAGFAIGEVMEDTDGEAAQS